MLRPRRGRGVALPFAQDGTGNDTGDGTSDGTNDDTTAVAAGLSPGSPPADDDGAGAAVLSASYAPGISVGSGGLTFVTDAAILGVYTQTGNKLPSGLDTGERDAVAQTVAASKRVVMFFEWVFVLEFVGLTTRAKGPHGAHVRRA